MNARNDQTFKGGKSVNNSITFSKNTKKTISKKYRIDVVLMVSTVVKIDFFYCKNRYMPYMAYTPYMSKVV